ncbi:hypothetical protein [Burkholderia sp. AU45388]|uniref:hypothetical protein n=1 Tax=Burkholderia sp. AU45388 TaxID=3059206 RepID=UPI00264C06CC|nr:hypothetical protein [Burkholderia sp. AU45388]MDN7430886.1 hypothetical protein [Burkholderia sp. AU45388]
MPFERLRRGGRLEPHAGIVGKLRAQRGDAPSRQRHGRRTHVTAPIDSNAESIKSAIGMKAQIST